MGFQTADLRSFCLELPKLPGVTGVFLLGSPQEDEGTIFVTVEGWGKEGSENRFAILTKLAEFRAENRFEIEQAGFIFNYHVLIDDPELNDMDIPGRAEPFHVSAAR